MVNVNVLNEKHLKNIKMDFYRFLIQTFWRKSWLLGCIWLQRMETGANKP